MTFYEARRTPPTYILVWQWEWEWNGETNMDREREVVTKNGERDKKTMNDKGKGGREKESMEKQQWKRFWVKMVCTDTHITYCIYQKYHKHQDWPWQVCYWIPLMPNMKRPFTLKPLVSERIMNFNIYKHWFIMKMSDVLWFNLVKVEIHELRPKYLIKVAKDWSTT